MKRTIQKLLTLLALFFLSLSVCAQSDSEIAKDQLNKMKNSFILVRLKTDSLKIHTLEKDGYKEEAEKVKKDLYNENRETILSFSKTFDFCPVYFFYSNSSDQIRKGNLIGNVFDYELNLVKKELLSSQTFFTAEFGKTKNLGIHGLILMDNFFVPLKSPFPFYQRQYVFFSMVKQSKATIAKRLNKRLTEQYKTWNNPEWGFK